MKPSEWSEWDVNELAAEAERHFWTLRDFAKARMWLERAAQRGHEISQFMLSLCQAGEEQLVADRVIAEANIYLRVFSLQAMSHAQTWKAPDLNYLIRSTDLRRPCEKIKTQENT